MRKLGLMIVGCLGALVAMAAGEDQVDWKAQWIWQEEDGPANAWVAFRRTIQLDKVPEKVTANISADSKYWLWINGEMVVFEGSVARGPSPHKPTPFPPSPIPSTAPPSPPPQKQIPSSWLARLPPRPGSDPA